MPLGCFFKPFFSSKLVFQIQFSEVTPASLNMADDGHVC